MALPWHSGPPTPLWDPLFRPPPSPGGHTALQKLFFLLYFQSWGHPPAPTCQAHGEGSDGSDPPSRQRFGTWGPAPRSWQGEQPLVPPKSGWGGQREPGGLHDLVAAADALHQAAGEDDAQDLGKQGRGCDLHPAQHAPRPPRGSSPTLGVSQPHTGGIAAPCPTSKKAMPSATAATMRMFFFIQASIFWRQPWGAGGRGAQGGPNPP